MCFEQYQATSSDGEREILECTFVHLKMILICVLRENCGHVLMHMSMYHKIIHKA